MDILTAFTNHYTTPPSILVRAPGRVNLLGEHVDYNDGVVLPAAIDRAVRLAAAPTTDGVVHLYALDLNKQAAFRLDALAQRSGLDGTPLPHWAAYPAGVAWALGEAGMPVGGMQVVYTSDVPIGAGLSSSAAVEVAFAAAWRALGGWEMDNLRLAQALPARRERLCRSQFRVDGSVRQRLWRGRARAVF